ncbi:Uncharacterised protein [Mycobacteroides abscessus subsp. abscessus]|nr:Uncharacterised protein [Mycobacteroides abscessus subsp. abscessus]
MLNAFTHCINTRVIGLHGVIHQHPTIAAQTSLFSQGFIWSNPDGEDHQIGIQHCPVF